MPIFCYIERFSGTRSNHMKIVMIGQKGLPARSGGIERHVEIMAPGLASRGHDVVVYGRRWYVGDRPFYIPGVTQEFSFGIHTKHLDAITHSMTALIHARRHKPDIVHIHGTGAALLTPIARLIHPRAKVIVTIHCIDRVLSKWNGFAKSMFHLGERLACYFSHKTIAVSETLTRYCLTKYNRQAVFLTHPFPSMPAPEPDILEELSLDRDGYFLFVGRLIPDKQAHVLVDAYIKARKERPDLFEKKPLVIVGSGSSTEKYVDWMYRKVAGLSGVLMVGAKYGDELRALQANAFAHVFPTSSEGLSLAVLEAGAYARPVIATSIEANLEATGGNLFRCVPESIDSLSDAMISAAESDRETLERMGRSFAEHIRSKYHEGDRIDDLVRLYREAVFRQHELVTELATS